MNRLVTLGCSFTKDNYQKTWADYLGEFLNKQVENIGARGAGLDFLTARLMSYDLNATDTVAIMLPSADRFDWYIDTGNPLKKSALDIASWQNGKNSSLVKVDGTLSDVEGFVLSGGEHRGEKKLWFKYFYSEYKARLDFWKSVHYIQLYLESQGVKYLITSAYDKNMQIEQIYNCGITCTDFDIINKIDFSKFVYYKNDLGFLSFCKQNNYSFVDNHPVTDAHKHFAQYIINYV